MCVWQKDKKLEYLSIGMQMKQELYKLVYNRVWQVWRNKMMKMRNDKKEVRKAVGKAVL